MCFVFQLDVGRQLEDPLEGVANPERRDVMYVFHVV